MPGSGFARLSHGTCSTAKPDRCRAFASRRRALNGRSRPAAPELGVVRRFTRFHNHTIIMLDDQTVTLKCPKCSHEFPETVGRLKQDPKLICPSCAVNIQIEASSLREDGEHHTGEQPERDEDEKALLEWHSEDVWLVA